MPFIKEINYMFLDGRAFFGNYGDRSSNSIVGYAVVYVLRLIGHGYGLSISERKQRHTRR